MGIKWILFFIGIKLIIFIIILTSCSTHGITSEEARIHLTTINDILVNHDTYDGKMVQVGGWVSSLIFINCRYGAYTKFQLGKQSGKAPFFVSLGILAIKEGDFVSVTARYKNSADQIWIDSIEGPKTDRQQ